MADAQIIGEPVTIPVDVELGPSLSASVDGGLAEKISRQLAAVIDTLGLRGSPEVQVKRSNQNGTQPHELRVCVNDQECPYPRELLERIFRYTEGTAADSAESVALAIVEIVKLQPGVLASMDQSIPYCGRPPYSGMRAALTTAVALKLSVADAITIGYLQGNALAQGRSTADLAEDLIDALRPKAIQIQLDLEDLARLETSSGAPRQLLAALRQDLFNELGLQYPAFVFVPAPDLKPNSFRFTINDLTLAPWSGVETDPLEYMISVCLRSELRQNSACFISGSLVANQCDQFSRRFPALVSAVRSKVAVEDITRCFRALANDGVSIRDLRTILERLVDASLDHPGDTVSFLKAGMGRFKSGLDNSAVPE